MFLISGFSAVSAHATRRACWAHALLSMYSSNSLALKIGLIRQARWKTCVDVALRFVIFRRHQAFRPFSATCCDPPSNFWRLFGSGRFEHSQLGCCTNSVFSLPARWGLLDFNRALLLLRLLTRRLLLAVQIPVGTAGPPPRAPDPSGHCRASTASCRSQWALPDLNRDFQVAVGTAGPQPRAPDPSGHCRTSTASSRSQWALPDLNRDFQIAVGTAGPQPRLPDRSGHFRTSTGRMSEKMSDRMSEDMPDRMPENMPEDLPDRYAR